MAHKTVHNVTVQECLDCLNDPKCVEHLKAHCSEEDVAKMEAVRAGGAGLAAIIALLQQTLPTLLPIILQFLNQKP